MEYRNITWRFLDDDMRPTGKTEVRSYPVHPHPVEVRAKPICARSITKWEPKPLTAEEQEIIERYCAKAAFRKQCQARWLQMIQLGL